MACTSQLYKQLSQLLFLGFVGLLIQANFDYLITHQGKPNTVPISPLPTSFFIEFCAFLGNDFGFYSQNSHFDKVFFDIFISQKAFEQNQTKNINSTLRLPELTPNFLSVFYIQIHVIACITQIINIQVLNMDMLNKFQGFLISSCYNVTEFINAKTGLNIDVEQYCPVTGSHLWSRMDAILILIGILIAVGSILMKLLKPKQTNRSKTFYSKLLEIKEISHDTKIYTFGLPDNTNLLGLKIGEHLQLEAQIKGDTVARKYTPISRVDLKRNSFELMIKTYLPLPPNFPDGGLMSQYVRSLKIGDQIKVSLPYGRFNYLGKSHVQIKELSGKINKRKVDHIYMVAGGTGINPLYQIIQYVSEAEKPNERPDLTLLFANRTEDDILVKSELEAFSKENSTFKCYFSVDRTVKEGWTGFVGFINDDKIGQTLGSRNLQNSLFLVCGPPILCNIVEKSLTTKFNVKPEQFFRF